MSYRIPYPYLLNIGVLESTDIIPILRPAFNEGSATVADIAAYVNPYKVYRVDMSQVSTGDPTVDYIYENTIGDIVWSYNGFGSYFGTLTGAFLLVPNITKTFFSSTLGGGVGYYTITRRGDDYIELLIKDKNFINSDDALNLTFIEIITYPVAL